MRATAVFILAAVPLWAQPPAIRTGGVVNAASRTPSILPGGPIARGLDNGLAISLFIQALEVQVR
jgi:hypothetical protein